MQVFGDDKNVLNLMEWGWGGVAELGEHLPDTLKALGNPKVPSVA